MITYLREDRSILLPLLRRHVLTCWIILGFDQFRWVFLVDFLSRWKMVRRPLKKKGYQKPHGLRYPLRPRVALSSLYTFRVIQSLPAYGMAMAGLT